MKIALISDIHGNSEALEAVISDIAKKDIDTVICLGDIATIGPQPLAVFSLLMQSDYHFIIGNHDEALLYPHNSAACDISPPLLPSLHWCHEQLQEEHFNFLHRMDASKSVQMDNDSSLLCFHGSPESSTDILLPGTPTEKMHRYFRKVTETVLAGGHTHIQMSINYYGKPLINPGSVGAPFKRTPSIGEQPELNPWAEYAIIELNRGRFSAELRRILYDLDRWRSIISQSDLPVKQWWLEQYRNIT